MGMGWTFRQKKLRVAAVVHRVPKLLAMVLTRDQDTMIRRPVDQVTSLRCGTHRTSPTCSSQVPVSSSISNGRISQSHMTCVPKSEPAANQVSNTRLYWTTMSQVSVVLIIGSLSSTLSNRPLIVQKKLRLAANSGDTELIRRLLDDGADPCACDHRNRTPLHFAACKGDVAVGEQLRAPA